MPTRPEIACTIRAALKAKHLTSEQAGALMYVSEYQVFNWRQVRAVPNAGNVELVAQVLGVSVASLTPDDRREGKPGPARGTQYQTGNWPQESAEPLSCIHVDARTFGPYCMLKRGRCDGNDTCREFALPTKSRADRILAEALEAVGRRTWG